MFAQICVVRPELRIEEPQLSERWFFDQGDPWGEQLPFGHLSRRWFSDFELDFCGGFTSTGISGALQLLVSVIGTFDLLQSLNMRRVIRRRFNV